MKTRTAKFTYTTKGAYN